MYNNKILATYEETLQITSPMESDHSNSAFSVVMQDEHTQEFSTSSLSPSSSSSAPTTDISRVASARALFQQPPTQLQPLQQKQQQQQKVQEQIKAHQQELQQRVQKAQHQAQMQVQQQHSARREPTTTYTTPTTTTTHTFSSTSTTSTTSNTAIPSSTSAPPSLGFSQPVPHTPPQTPRQQQPLPKPHGRTLSNNDLSEEIQHVHANAHLQPHGNTHAQSYADATHRNSARDAIMQGDATQRKTLQQLRPTPPLPPLKLHGGRSDSEMVAKSVPKLRDEEDEEEWEGDASGEQDPTMFVFNSNKSTPRVQNHRYDVNPTSSDEEQQGEQFEGKLSARSKAAKNTTKRKVKKDSDQLQQQQQQQLQLLLQHQLQQQLQQQLEQLQKQQPKKFNKYHEDDYDEIIQHRRLRGRSAVDSSDEDYERYHFIQLLLIIYIL